MKIVGLLVFIMASGCAYTENSEGKDVEATSSYTGDDEVQDVKWRGIVAKHGRDVEIQDGFIYYKCSIPVNLTELNREEERLVNDKKVIIEEKMIDISIPKDEGCEVVKIKGGGWYLRGPATREPAYNATFKGRGPCGCVFAYPD